MGSLQPLDGFSPGFCSFCSQGSTTRCHEPRERPHPPRSTAQRGALHFIYPLQKKMPVTGLLCSQVRKIYSSFKTLFMKEKNKKQLKEQRGELFFLPAAHTQPPPCPGCGDPGDTHTHAEVLSCMPAGVTHFPILKKIFLKTKKKIPPKNPGGGGHSSKHELHEWATKPSEHVEGHRATPRHAGWTLAVSGKVGEGWHPWVEVPFLPPPTPHPCLPYVGRRAVREGRRCHRPPRASG